MMEVRSINVALCASAKKHTQSFDELKRTAVRCEEMYRNRYSISFHFLHLNYDEEIGEMKLSSSTGVIEDNSNNNNNNSSNLDEEEVEEWNVDVVMHKVATFGTQRANVALQEWCNKVKELKESQRQWLLQQEQSYKEENVRYCSSSDNNNNSSINNNVAVVMSYHRAPLIVIDPLDKVSQLVSRSNLHSILHDIIAHKTISGIHTPRTLHWRRPMENNNNDFNSSITQKQESEGENNISNNNIMEIGNGAVDYCSSAELWWIAKPDQGTGPSFTHNLLIYNISLDLCNLRCQECHSNLDEETDTYGIVLSHDKLREDQEETLVHNIAPPLSLHQMLPSETNEFVLQEFYINALPVIIKVYVADAQSLFIDVRSTLGLLTRIETVMQQQQEEEEFNLKCKININSKEPACLCIDSQDRLLFTYDNALQTKNNNTESNTLPSKRESNEYVEWEVQKQCWSSYVNDANSPLHDSIVKLVELFACEPQCGLSLYGFDLVLVPRELLERQRFVESVLHTYCGKESGQETKQETKQEEECSVITSTEQHKRRERRKVTQRYPFHELFEKRNLYDDYQPTPLLQHCEAVIIDMNYFPGYKGVK